MVYAAGVSEQSSDTVAEPSAQRSICVECGVCCSDALFGYVPLGEDEEQSLADLFAIERIGGRPAFRVACPHVSDCRCTVYDRRPRTCRQYRCKTLVEYDNGSIGHEEAFRRVGAIRRAMLDLRPHLRPGESISASRVRRAELASGGRIARDDAAFVLKAIALDVLIDRFLRSEKQRLIEFQTAMTVVEP
jgi:Fe-S-cluster containining protein